MLVPVQPPVKIVTPKWKLSLQLRCFHFIFLGQTAMVHCSQWTQICLKCTELSLGFERTSLALSHKLESEVPTPQAFKELYLKIAFSTCSPPRWLMVILTFGACEQSSGCSSSWSREENALALGCQMNSRVHPCNRWIINVIHIGVIFGTSNQCADVADAC